LAERVRGPGVGDLLIDVLDSGHIAARDAAALALGEIACEMPEEFLRSVAAARARLPPSSRALDELEQLDV
jgi:hypothetical protein